MIMIDARPGALEELFVTKKPNKAGIYGMKIYINGERKVVHVDDFLPYTRAYRYGK